MRSSIHNVSVGERVYHEVLFETDNPFADMYFSRYLYERNFSFDVGRCEGTRSFVVYLTDDDTNDAKAFFDGLFTSNESSPDCEALANRLYEQKSVLEKYLETDITSPVCGLQCSIHLDPDDGFSDIINFAVVCDKSGRILWETILHKVERELAHPDSHWKSKVSDWHFRKNSDGLSVNTIAARHQSADRYAEKKTLEIKNMLTACHDEILRIISSEKPLHR